MEIDIDVIPEKMSRDISLAQVVNAEPYDLRDEDHIDDLEYDLMHLEVGEVLKI